MFVTTHSMPYPKGFLIQAQVIQSLKATATGSPCSPNLWYLRQQLRDRRIPPPQIWSVEGRQNKWNDFISSHFPQNTNMGNSRSEERALFQEPFLHFIPTWEAACAGTGSPWHPQIPARDLQPSLPYELAGQVLHKMIDLIPVMQDTSWSRDTMITGHISWSFPSHLFCHTLLSEAFDSVLFNTNCPCSSFKERSNCNWHFLLNFQKQE